MTRELIENLLRFWPSVGIEVDREGKPFQSGKLLKGGNREVLVLLPVCLFTLSAAVGYERVLRRWNRLLWDDPGIERKPIEVLAVGGD